MGITRKVGAGICLLAGLLVGGQVQADQCDDLNDQAKQAREAGNNSLSQQNYQEAISSFDQAAQYLEQIAAIGDCRCPLILKHSTPRAQEIRQTIAKLETNIIVMARFNEAKNRYDQGEDLARNANYDAAIGEFEAAAMIWDEIVNNYPDNNNAETSRNNAQLARNAADQARAFAAR